MENTDYNKLGFKCGIEIHQQLEGKKLFCGCPTFIRDDESDIKVKRNLRAVAGETGVIDKAAQHEMKKSKEFIYHAYSDTTCLVELDEEPPHEINQEALTTALQFSLLLNAKIIDKIQIMRKTVIDGSNTSGFQRTTLVGINGFIETSKGKVRIPTICLEEEAAKIIKRTESHDIYNLSRLGIPLIEIATETDIKDPEHAKEVAYKLGLILRSTGKCKRGLGSIRQDINISIKKGARTEIKGFQDYRNIAKIINFEIKRQLELIKKKKKVEASVRKAEPDNTTSYLRPMPGADRMYPETDIKTIIPKIEGIKVEKLDDKIKRLKKIGLNESIIDIIIRKNIKLEDYIKEYPKINPSFIAETIINTPKEIKKRHNLEIDIFNYIDKIFSRLNKSEINKEAVFEILVELAQGKKPNYEKYKAVDDKKIETEIKDIIKTKPGLSFGAYMGLVMAKFRGKIDGKTASAILKKYIK